MSCYRPARLENGPATSRGHSKDAHGISCAHAAVQGEQSIQRPIIRYQTGRRTRRLRLTEEGTIASRPRNDDRADPIHDLFRRWHNQELVASSGPCFVLLEEYECRPAISLSACIEAFLQLPACVIWLLKRESPIRCR